MRLRAAVVGLLLVAGCSSKGEAPPATGAAASVMPTAGRTSPPVAPAAAGKAPSKAAAVVEDPAVRAAYRAGMRTGRKATGAKRYAEAIAGFDAALVAKPNDARALGERGYARLLEGADLAAATRDFDAAADGTKDQKLLSTIWFNRGLVHEKRGDQENATASFAIANLMRPTRAAAARLAGKSTCTLEVLRGFMVEDHLPVKAADWLTLARALPHEEDAAPATVEEALEALADAKTEPTLPTIITTRMLGERIAYAVWRSGKQLHATAVGMAWDGRCPGDYEFEIEDSNETYLHVRGSEMAMGGHTYMCEDKDGDLIECLGVDDEVSAGTACLGGSQSLRDLVIDLTTGRVVIAVEEPDTGTARPAIELEDKALTIRGRGCDRALAL